MPITPSALRQRRAVCHFEYMGETVTAEYYPASLGPETGPQLKGWIARATVAQERQDEDEARATLYEFGVWICAILAAWDYLEDAPDPTTGAAVMVPITPERLADEMARFPDFIMAVLVAIIQDRARGNVNGTTSPAPSGATSSPTVPSTPSPVKSSLSLSASSTRRAGSRARRA